MKTKYIKIVFFALIIGVCIQNMYAQLLPYDLKLEYRESPEGIDVKKPRFFWKLKSDESRQFQNAYQIIVANTKENIDKNIGDIYNSKKVKSSQTTQIVYNGKPLQPAK